MSGNLSSIWESNGVEQDLAMLDTLKKENQLLRAQLEVEVNLKNNLHNVVIAKKLCSEAVWQIKTDQLRKELDNYKSNFRCDNDNRAAAVRLNCGCAICEHCMYNLYRYYSCKNCGGLLKGYISLKLRPMDNDLLTIIVSLPTQEL